MNLLTLSRTALNRSHRLLTIAALLAAATTAQANIVYQVNRTVGAGTVVGQITTDGTLGALTVSDFVSWSLTMTAPDIHDGLPATITTGSNPFTEARGNALFATASQLLFDFSIDALMFAYTNAGGFWCLAGGGVGDTGCFDQGEILGYSDTTFGAAYVTPRSGRVAIGTAAATVPLPASWTLAGLGLGLLGLQRRQATRAV